MLNIYVTRTLLCMVLTIAAFHVYALAGQLDPTFDGDGIVVSDLSPTKEDLFRKVVIQPDGKIVTVGRWQLGIGTDHVLVARYNTDGSFDTTFGGGDGYIVDDFFGDSSASAVAIQPDGKIVVAGGMGGDAIVFRYHPDGTPDDSFDFDGRALLAFTYPPNNFTSSESAVDLEIASDGAILVGLDYFGGQPGLEDYAIVRLKTDGSLDTTFDGDGLLAIDLGGDWDDLADITLQPDGKMVMTGFTNNGYAMGVVRYNADGTPDTGFGNNGIVIVDEVSRGVSVALQPDGKIVAAGVVTITPHKIAIARLNTNGTLDTSFATDGAVVHYITDFDGATGLALQDNGKILVSGGKDDLAVARFNTDGSLDTGFGNGGSTFNDLGVFDGLSDIAIDPEGRLVGVGFANINGIINSVVARYDISNSTSGDGELVQNGGFETAGVTLARADKWTPVNPLKDKRKCGGLGAGSDCTFQFKGQIGNISAINQNLDLTGVSLGSGTTLYLNAMVDAKNLKGASIKAVVFFTDTTKDVMKIKPPAGTYAYTDMVSATLALNKAVNKIKVKVGYNGASGRFRVDDVSLTYSTAARGWLSLPPAP